VLRFESCLRVDRASGLQEADAAATPELEVPVPGTVHHFSSNEQETVKTSFLSLHGVVEAARCVRKVKGSPNPHLTTSGAATEERYSPCSHQVMP